MKIEIKVPEEEVRKLVADYLSEMLGITVPASEITSGRYSSGEYTLGQYGGFEYPPIPKPATVPASPVVTDSADASDKLLASPPADPPF